MKITIDQFIEELINEKHIKNTFNQYASNSEHSLIAIHNLKLYLEKMQMLEPKVMFIGEAPGYKGCKLTGIPFTSEKLVFVNSKSGILGKENNYQVRNFDKLQSESSATIMWGAFEEYNFFPILWNAFPFHPHKENEINTNRAPKSEELLVGMKYINYLVEMFSIEEVYAIGNIAHSTLSKLGKEVKKIRHPSMGGKAEFIQGIKEIIEKR